MSHKQQCPKCGKWVPTNEWISYRRHEDCYVNQLATPMQDRAARQAKRLRLPPFKGRSNKVSDGGDFG